MHNNIILAHNAKLKSEANKLKRKNRDVDLVWAKIHQAIDKGNSRIWIEYREVIDFNHIKKVFEQYGYKCEITDGELDIDWCYD